jgi:hypothetical protein
MPISNGSGYSGVTSGLSRLSAAFASSVSPMVGGRMIANGNLLRFR